MMLLLFFFNDTATTEIYTLSLHDALPICMWQKDFWQGIGWNATRVLVIRQGNQDVDYTDRKSTRLNSSHLGISYAVFCLKKKSTSQSKRKLRRHKDP